MREQTTNTIRLGVLALPAVGLLYVITLLIRGPLVFPSGDQISFAKAVSSLNYSIWEFGSMTTAILDLFGVLALYAYLAGTRVQRWALVALTLTFIHDAFYLTFLGFWAYALPAVGTLYLQGQQAVIGVAALTGTVIEVISLGGILGAIGFLLFGFAIWRSGVLPKWPAIPLAFFLPLLAFGPVVSFYLEFLGAILLVVAAGGITFSVWRSPARRTNLGGGEKQRVAVAIALANDSTIILADGPSGNLDPKAGSEIAKVRR